MAFTFSESSQWAGLKYGLVLNANNINGQTASKQC